MDATAPSQVTINPQPIIPLYKPPEDSNYSGDQGRMYLVTQSLYLAQRVAERGKTDDARAEISKNAIPQANAIYDPGQRATAWGYINALIGDGGYIQSLEPKRDQLVRQATISDLNYKNAQVLNAGQLEEFNADNADTRAAMDAQLAGGNASLTYGASTVKNAGAKAVNGAADAAKQAVGGVSNIAKGIVTEAVGPWGYILAGLGVVLLIVGGIYLYSVKSTASAIAGRA